VCKEKRERRVGRYRSENGKAEWKAMPERKREGQGDGGAKGTTKGAPAGLACWGKARCDASFAGGRAGSGPQGCCHGAVKLQKHAPGPEPVEW